MRDRLKLASVWACDSYMLRAPTAPWYQHELLQHIIASKPSKWFRANMKRSSFRSLDIVPEWSKDHRLNLSVSRLGRLSQTDNTDRHCLCRVWRREKKTFFPGQWVHTDRQADGSKEEQVGRGTANLSAAQCGARRERRSAHCIRHTDTQQVISTKPLYYFTCSRLTVLGGLIHSFCKHNVVVWTQLTVTLHSQLLWRRTTVKGFILKYL